MDRTIRLSRQHARAPCAYPTRSALPRASTRTRAYRTRCCGLGCGFAEIGTVTPLPQSGNPRPRVFRLIARPRRHQPARLQQRRATPRRWRGCSRAGCRRRGRRQHRRQQGRGRPRSRLCRWRATLFYDVASYFTVNISSPNTPGLRDLQAPAALDELLARVLRHAPSSGGRRSRSGRSWSRSPPTSPRTTCGPSRACWWRTGSTASPYRTRRCRGRGSSDTVQCASRPAACPGGRCSIAPRSMLARVHHADRRAHPADRHRRHRLGRRRRIAKIEAGATPDAALHRTDLRGPGSARSHQARSRRHARDAPAARASPRRRAGAQQSGRPSRSTVGRGSHRRRRRARKIRAGRRWPERKTPSARISSQIGNDDHGAEQEILEGPLKGRSPAHDAAEQLLAYARGCSGIDAERGEHDADHDRQQDQPHDHARRRCRRRTGVAVHADRSCSHWRTGAELALA